MEITLIGHRPLADLSYVVFDPSQLIVIRADHILYPCLAVENSFTQFDMARAGLLCFLGALNKFLLGIFSFKMNDVDAEAQAAVVLDRHAPQESIHGTLAELFGDQSFD